MAILPKRKFNPEDDLGFGTQAVIRSQRLVNRDGSINVKRKGLSIFNTSNNYHTLITMSWAKFWLLVLSGYLTANIIFAFIYVSLGPGTLNGAVGNTFFYRFMDAFFFSAQTISTVGYGHISPHGMAANSVAAFESMMGLLAFALATGLLYGRFSRPSAKIKYSEHLLVAPYRDNGKGLMFRLTNLRRNTLIDLQMEVIFSYNEDVDGKKIRRFLSLELERKRVSILTLSWTVVHSLDNDSPLKDITPEEMANGEASFAVLLKAFDDTFSQTVHSRTSYMYDEIVWGAKFKPTFDRDEEGRIVLNLDKIDDYELVDG
ncbi:MAG: Inward rectifier potassium channel Kirbac3 [Mucilaginibacter sp.]|uniref:ion channel n=1 Tax=Mucilaginibacter sp. TaxID=1882438 RepID=UPI0026124FCD|nr:ion channel [Mucilaginibacter sp.]MDB5002897.1 Inward rectifier potassium channel Kirbac3 [Mucilaginibacter sp.]